MKIEYSSKKLERICVDYNIAQKQYGVDMAKLIHLRIDQLEAAESVESLLQYSVGRCHRLKGNRKNEQNKFAMDLAQPYRLVFAQSEENVCVVLILEIVDYH